MVRQPIPLIFWLNLTLKEPEMAKNMRSFRREMTAMSTKKTGTTKQLNVLGLKMKKCPNCGAEMRKNINVKGWACAECGHVENG